MSEKNKEPETEKKDDEIKKINEDDGTPEKTTFEYADNASSVNSISVGGQELMIEEPEEKSVKIDESGDEKKPGEDTDDVDSESDEPVSLDEDETSEESPTEGETADAVESIPFKVRFNSFLDAIGFPGMFFARFIGLYMLISSFNFSNIARSEINPIDPIENWKEYVPAVPGAGTILWILLGFVLLTIVHSMLDKKYRVIDQFVLIAGTMSFAINIMWRNDNFYLCMGVVAVSVVFIGYAIQKLNQRAIARIPNWLVIGLTVICAVGVGAFIGVCTVDHYKIFGTSTFDMGIFVQMFHSMVTDFTANTTCEREELLSHFNIHTSFIYYLLAPIYALFRNGSTLLIAQAVLAMGGVIPFVLIAKNHNYKGLPLFFAGLLYVFCSGFIGPCFYEFHENCFLPTLLMWLLYAVDKRKIILFYIMSVLVCIVKEDAPLYVICISMYMFFDEKELSKRIHGIIMTFFAIGYFIMVINWLNENGDGSMMAATRFGILTIDPEDGFAGVIRNVLADPAYFFSLLVKEETHIFFLQVMVPLLFLPFICKKIHRFLLILPFVIMNLVIGAGYGYAANIGFQYIFGPAALLIYMVIINCADLKPSRRNMLVGSAAAASIIVSVCLCSGEISHYEGYNRDKERFDAMDKCISSVPKDGSVAANTWFLPHCADRSELYTLDDSDFITNPADENDKALKDIDKYDFYVLSYNDPLTSYTVPQIQAAGYTMYDEVPNWVVVYVSPNYAEAE